MSELQTLFIVLTVLYLIQCVHHLPQRAVVFRRQWRGKWRVRARGWVSSSGDLPWVFLNPLLPSYGAIVCHAPILAHCAQGVSRPGDSSVARGQRGNFTAFEGLRTIEADGNLILIDAKAFAKTPCSTYASYAAAFLDRLRVIPEHQRVAAIQAELSRMLDRRLIRDRLSAFEVNAALLRGECDLLFLYLFVITPLIVWWLGLWTWLIVALGFVVILCLLARSFLRTFAILYPEANYSRWVAAAALLSPPAAVRATDGLLRDLVCTFHPLAVASVLCSREDFKGFASRILREIRFTPPTGRLGSSSEPEAGDRWYREELDGALWAFVGRYIGSPEELLGPPKQTSGECRSYCPRCWTQYVISSGNCLDCGGLPLRSFEDVAADRPPDREAN